MIRYTVKGDFNKTRSFLKKIRRIRFESLLTKYAQEGVEALSSATPVRTGKTAESWYYEIKEKPGSISIFWNNTNRVNGIPIAIIIDYGHATKNGVYVRGRHYISPAIQPVFDKIAAAAWEEVRKS